MIALHVIRSTALAILFSAGTILLTVGIWALDHDAPEWASLGTAASGIIAMGLSAAYALQKER